MVSGMVCSTIPVSPLHLQPLRVTGQLDVPLAFYRPALLRTCDCNRPFPIGDAAAARRAQFLIGEQRDDVQHEVKGWNFQLPFRRIRRLALMAGPGAGRFNLEVRHFQMTTPSIREDDRAA